MIHRDLACRNILVGTSNGKYVCKVGDLGLARHPDENTGFYQRDSLVSTHITYPSFNCFDAFLCVCMCNFSFLHSNVEFLGVLSQYDITVMCVQHKLFESDIP